MDVLSNPLTWIACALSAAVAFLVGWLVQYRLSASGLARARARAEEILREGERESRAIRRRAKLASKEEWLKHRARMESEARSKTAASKQREKQLRAREAPLRERETQLRRRESDLARRETAMQSRDRQLAGEEKRLAGLVQEENETLGRISGLTRDEARRQLLANLQTEARYEAASLIRDIKEEAQKTAEDEARKIMSLAIERLASDVSAERTVSTFPLPNKNLKGRIIGHEGRNIRAFEKATGIQLLFDEDPDTVTLSGFNPVRREIARMTLERLLKDGNINPQRIEELVARCTRSLEDAMRRAGEEAVKEFGLRGIHPEIIRLLGRLKYRTSYGQNVLAHVKEVAHLTGIMAAELGLDQKLAKRSGLLHDIGKAIDYEREGTHPEIGKEVATRYGEPPIVINAIASHHEDCEVISPISVLVAAADALSGARPGARRHTLADYVQRIEKLETLANSLDGVEQSYAIQAGREIRVICHHRKVDDAQASLLASDLAKRIQNEMDYPGRIKVTVIRELRAVEYARHNKGNGNEKGMAQQPSRRVRNSNALRAARNSH
jgi:ribonuclease Y